MVPERRHGNEENQFGQARAVGYDAHARLLQVQLDDLFGKP